MASDPVVAPLLALLRLSVTAAMLAAGCAVAAVAIAVVALCVFAAAVRLRQRQKDPATAATATTVGLFHPFCNAGGGGERVLWVAIRAMKKRFPSADFVVYTGDLEVAPDQILAKARKNFNVDLQDGSIRFVYLHKRSWVEAANFPFFTLLGQALASVFLGWEALSLETPDVFIDTMGFAFTLPLAKLWFGCRTGAYVHYPTISTNMLHSVRTRKRGFNNRAIIADSRLATNGKIIYYKFFAYLYGLAGRCADVVMVNSTWTEGHISTLWSRESDVRRVYPPCDVDHLLKIPRKDDPDKLRILSLGQFRPEKDHALQIRALAKLRDRIMMGAGSQDDRDSRWQKILLVLVGGVRDSQDESRVSDLRALCSHLAIDQNVDFRVNVTFDELQEELAKATIGIHTMCDEHFGIAVVEMLAAGLVTIAHRSGGPQLDIIVESPEESRNGFLASSEDEYADALEAVASMTPEGKTELRERAKDSVGRFSEAAFEAGWVRTVEAVINIC